MGPAQHISNSRRTISRLSRRAVTAPLLRAKVCGRSAQPNASAHSRGDCKTHYFVCMPKLRERSRRCRKRMISEHWPERPQLGRRSVDRCDVFPVALGVEAIYLNRRGSMKSMLCAAIGAAHWIDGRPYQPGPSKQQLCSARAIHHSLLRSWHQVRFALKTERQMSLRVMVTPFWRRPRNLIGPQQSHCGSAGRTQRTHQEIV